jgi:hypothetical protein
VGTVNIGTRDGYNLTLQEWWIHTQKTISLCSASESERSEDSGTRVQMLALHSISGNPRALSLTLSRLSFLLCKMSTRKLFTLLVIL